MTPQDVLTFWFEEASGKWFAKDATFDAKIRERFLDTYWKVAKGETEDWRKTPEGRLAEILVLDQFARNMFRDTPQAFANDPQAFTLAQQAVEIGYDKKLGGAHRQFLYMPYMHSESHEAHKRAIWLFLSLPFWRWGVLYFEIAHKKIIDRFGRYPHRNQTLGRASTPEELQFLKRHKGF